MRLLMRGFNVHFPLRGMVSLLSVMQTGEAIETGIVGADGVASTGIDGIEIVRSQAQAADPFRHQDSAIARRLCVHLDQISSHALGYRLAAESRSRRGLGARCGDSWQAVPR
jgi:hypothetical protein